MTATSPKAFMLSLSLHGAIAAALLFLARGCGQQVETMKIIELVAGEGDNYGATVAPALGVEGGAKLDLPAPPEPQAPRPEPPAPAPEPEIVPAPPPKSPPKQPAADAPRDFAKDLKAQVRAATARAKREIAREEAAQKKQAELEKKRAEEQQKKQTKLTKEEFDKQNKGKTAPSTPTTKSGTTKVAKIDTEGIRKGVVGGSTQNKVGGAGGKALKVENPDLLAAYYSLFKQRLRAAFEGPPGLSDSLQATIEAQSHADGHLSNARVIKSSGSPDFDRAVLDAVRRVQMPERPDKKTETIEFVFTMRERNEG